MFELLQRSMQSFFSTYKFRFLGMGFMWAWTYCCWFTSALYPNSAGFAVNASFTWSTSVAAATVTLLAAPLLLRSRDAFSIRWLHAATVAMIVGGTFLMADESLNGIASQTIHRVGALSAGVGTGIFWLMWGNLYENMKEELMEVAIPMASLLVPLCLFVVHSLSGIAAFAALLALPLLSYLSLALSFADHGSLEKPGEDEIAARDFWPEFMRIGLAAVVIHAVIALMWAITPNEYFRAMGGWFGAPMLIGAVAATAISLAQIFLSRRPDIFTMYRWLLPVIVTALTALSLGTLGGTELASALGMVAQLGYSVILYVFFSRIAHRGLRNSTICLGFSRGLVMLGTLLGSSLARAIIPLASSGEVSLSTICTVLICACVISVLLLLNRESSFRSTPPMAQAPMAESLPFETEGACCSAGERAGEIACVEERAPVPIEKRCGEIAKEYGLSARELEVFTLLAQGRSIPYVRDFLCISKNTADTHAKNIYRKTGVHSRQELIDLVRPSS